MAYLCELGPNQWVFLDNQGEQTILTVASSSLGQQQQASNGFHTGVWTAPPQLFQTPMGVVIKLSTMGGDRYLQVQGSSMGVASSLPDMNQAQQMQMQQVATPPAPATQPMQPMQPLKMGNMTMNANPMEMRIGDMEMRMGTAATATTASSRRFCSQCGLAVQPTDRFCASCGHALG